MMLFSRYMIIFLTIDPRETEYLYKNYSQPLFHIITNINLKWIIALNLKSKIINFLEKHLEKDHFHFVLDNNFLYNSPNHEA